MRCTADFSLTAEHVPLINPLTPHPGRWLQVFYWKMAGDYWRYRAEFASGDDRKAKAEKAKDQYEAATRAAVDQGLPPTNPIRLGLALNYSACCVVAARARRRPCERWQARGGLSAGGAGGGACIHQPPSCPPPPPCRRLLLRDPEPAAGGVHAGQDRI